MAGTENRSPPPAVIAFPSTDAELIGLLMSRLMPPALVGSAPGDDLGECVCGGQGIPYATMDDSSTVRVQAARLSPGRPI